MRRFTLHGVGAPLVSVAVEAGVDYGVRKAKKITLDEAKKLKREALESMGLPPDLPIKFPKELTAEGVKDAAYSVGKVYAEKAFAAEFGFSIELPKKLTLKDLENMVGSIFPDDAIEAINLALSIGVQLATSALTSVLAGTAIGSAIPGIGTVVGLAVGLAVAGIKGLFFHAPTHPEGRACKFATNPRVRAGGCPKPPNGLNSFQFFTWATTEMKPLWDGLRKEQSTRACGRGGAINCVRGLSFMRDTAFGVSLATVDRMGLLALNAALAEVQRAPDIESKPEAGSGFGEGAITFVSGYAGVQPVSKELRPIYDAKGRLIAAIKQRRTKLQALIATADTINKIPARGNVALKLWWDLVTELQHAAVQVQNNPNADSVRWFATLAGYVQQLEARQEAARKADALEVIHRRAVAFEKGFAAKVTAPGTLTAATRAAVVKEQRAACFQLFTAWAQIDRRADCLQAEDIERCVVLCQANLAGQITQEALVRQLEVVVHAACKRAHPSILDAFLVGFSRSGNPFVREG